MCKCARAARMSGGRDARCASLLVCAWLQSPRAQRTLALPIKERFSPAFRLVFHFLSHCTTLPVLGFVPLRLCASSLLCAFAPLLSSLLCSSGFVSASALHLSTPRLCLSLVASDFYNNINIRPKITLFHKGEVLVRKWLNRYTVSPKS